MSSSLPKEKWQPIAKELVDQGLFTLGVEIWSRAGFRCEYCDSKLLISPQTYRYAHGE